MKKYIFTQKFHDEYVQMTNIEYKVWDGGAVYWYSYPNGKIDKDWNVNDYRDSIFLMTDTFALENGYVIIIDVIPFKIGSYCISDDFGAVQIASVRELETYNLYYTTGGEKVIHTGLDSELRAMTNGEIGRYL